MAADAKRRLTPKRERFVEFYTGECAGNAAEAYERAGFKCKTRRVAEVEGSKLLRMPEVARAIAEAVQEVRQEAIATREERQRLLTQMLRGEVSEERIAGGGDAGPQVMDIKLGGKDRLKAIELLGKMQGDYIERHEHSGPNGGPIETRNAEYDETMRKLFGGDK